MGHQSKNLFSMSSNNEIEIAVFTRGYSRSNDYHWKATSLPNRNDETPDEPVLNQLSNWDFRNTLDLETPGIVVAKKGTRFAILLSDLPTDYRSTVAPGKIRVCFAFFNLTERQAAGLTFEYLQHWSKTSKFLVEAVSRSSKPPEWDFDDRKIRSYLNGIEKDFPKASSSAQSQKREKYVTPEDGGFLPYAAHVERLGFSKPDGLKIFIGEPSDSKTLSLLKDADFTALSWLPQPLPSAPAPSHKRRPHKSELSPKGIMVLVGLFCLLVGGFFFGRKKTPEKPPTLSHRPAVSLKPVPPIVPYRFDPAWAWGSPSAVDEFRHPTEQP